MTELDEFRSQKDQFLGSGQGPLTREQRKSFSGLTYFPENPGLRLEVQV